MQSDEKTNDRFTGWVKLDGKRLPCGPYGHLEVARNAAERNPEDAGWVHYSDGSPEPVVRKCAGRYISVITKKQLDEMGVIAVECGWSLAWWVADIEVG